MNCPICNTDKPTPLFQREQVPVHQHLLYPTPELACNTPWGQLAIVICPHCHFVYNAEFDLQLMNYGQAYDNNQTYSPAFMAHLDERIEYLLQKPEFQRGNLLEVGCGNGDFLIRLMQRTGPDMLAWGFDPSYQGPDANLAGRVCFSRETLENARLPEQADAVICRHVIEHIAQPKAWLQLLRQTLLPFPKVKLYFETPALEWILAGQVFWDFFYEHCNYFLQSTLSYLFESAGFRVESAQRIFGGQYHWFELSLAEPHLTLPEAGPVPAAIWAYQAQEPLLLANLRQRLTILRQAGPLALWGAGAKGVTLAGLLDPERKLIDSIIDLNPHKQGGYLPGTGHPIVAPTQLAERGIVSCLLMNPQYENEIRQLLTDLKLSPHLELPL